MSTKLAGGSYTAIDIFAGCGGLSLGLRQAGLRVIGAVEIDPLSVETYKKNHKKTLMWQIDIRRLSVSEVKRRLGLRTGQLDVLAACPPCQGFSTISTLNRGRSVGDRAQKNLVFEFVRFVRGLRPKAIMLENVPGLAKDWRIKRIEAHLKRLGYSVIYQVLDAADYGVPQRRKRMILVGSRYGKVNFAKALDRKVTVRDAIGSLPRPGMVPDPLHISCEKRSGRIQNMIKRIPKNGGSRSHLRREYQLDCHQRTDGFRDVYGRIAWDDVAPTITGGCINPSKGRFLHPSQDRAITLREAAALQTFPRHYQFSLRNGRYRTASLIGNALPPEFIRMQVVVLRKHLSRI